MRSLVLAKSQHVGSVMEIDYSDKERNSSM